MSQLRDRFRYPERIFTDVLKDRIYDEQARAGKRFLFRALVVAVDVIGGMLENPSGDGGVTCTLGHTSREFKARSGPRNPKNSIKARVITDGIDRFVDDDQLRVFWPFFPESICVPIKQGEYAYVLFEDENMRHGLWVSKVSGHEGVNYSPGSSHLADDSETRLVGLFPGMPGKATNDSMSMKTDDAASESKTAPPLSSRFNLR